MTRAWWGDRRTGAEAERTAPLPAVDRAHRLAKWRNGEHVAEWIGSLQRHVFPAIGARQIDTIRPIELIKALSPVWVTRRAGEGAPPAGAF